MLRVSDPDATIAFFELIGVKEVRRFDSEQGRFTLIFLAAEGQEGIAEVELTYNWGCRASGQYQASSTWETDV